ncbi:MAG TPA: thiamine-phosphate kinase [Spirochaetota bacterium]|nr:thiamine-phosphate kinase [Spirochaetota bacterium]
MLISTFGGEFALINSIKKKAKQKKVKASIGDDCAVIKNGSDYLLYTTDMLVENDHFSRDYFTAGQVGIKAMESNLSDIAAMGGKPLYVLTAVALTQNTPVEWVKDFYAAVYRKADKYNFDLIGGDTTHGPCITICITVIGTIKKQLLTMRKGARSGDLIRVTGYLGAAAAGYKLFKNKIPGHKWVKKKHTNPGCRLDVCAAIAAEATAMADISDGLAAEVKNICSASKKGALIYNDKIPVDKRVHKAARELNESALEYALFGGEDFELVYTVPADKASGLPGVTVGYITGGSKIYLQKKNRKPEEITAGGYNHFAL